MNNTQKRKVLKDRCKELGLTHYSNKSIEELEEMIANHLKSLEDATVEQTENIEDENQDDTPIEDDGVAGDGGIDYESMPRVKIPTDEEIKEFQSRMVNEKQEVISHLNDEDIKDVNEALEELAQQNQPKLYTQKGIVALQYIGENEREFRQGLTRPFPIINTNDIVFIDIKSARFMTRKNGGFKEIDLKNLSVQVQG